MTLRARTLISMAMTVMALLVVLYLLSRNIVLGSFVELEEQLALRSVEQVVRGVQNSAVTLDALARDWANWNDTYEFIQDHNAAYIESNLVDETFVPLRLNFMLFVDTRGDIVYAKGYDFHTGEPLPLPESLFAHLEAGMPLVHYPAADMYHAGIVLLPEAPLIIASRPILTSDGEGPVRGALLMARYLDEAEVAQLSETVLMPFLIRRFTEVPPDVPAALLAGDGMLVRPIDRDALVGYGLLDDIYGDPVLVVEHGISREISRQGARSITYFVGSLLVVGVVFGAVMLAMLEWSVLVRLTALSETVVAIGAQEDLSVRVTLTGKDELAQLGHALNRMLAALELSQQHREEAEQALRQYTRELEARNEELDAFAHTVAHDLKNPLGTIVGFSALLEMRGLKLSKEELHNSLNTIMRSGKRMARIIDELLLLASMHRMEDVAFAPLDLAGAFMAAQEQLEHLLQETDVTIVPPEVWPLAWGYAPWVEEVWANYLSNAIKYGGVPAHIEVGAEVQTDGMIRCWMRDNGAGLSPEEQARLFTPFTRLDQVRARGHGLGLSIVRRIVNKFGGEVGVESMLGAGSTFWFTLPGIPEDFVAPATRGDWGELRFESGA